MHYDAGFVYENVTSIFPRFYYDQCEMQVFLTRRAGLSLQDAVQLAQDSSMPSSERQVAAAFVLDFIRALANLSLTPESCRANPRECGEVFAPTREALLESLEDADALLGRSIASKVGNGRADEGLAAPVCSADLECQSGDSVVQALQRKAVRVFPVQISSVDEVVFRTGKKQQQVAVLAGDASMIPHYRLGVGVNCGFNSAIELYSMLMSTREGPTFPTLRATARTAKRRVQALVQLQLFTIIFEAYCGLVTYDEDVFWRRIGTANKRLDRIPRAAYALNDCFSPRKLKHGKSQQDELLESSPAPIRVSSNVGSLR
eukprot:scaffold8518_cov277-Pinguiococcus_pyrenoidosus.AAC.1